MIYRLVGERDAVSTAVVDQVIAAVPPLGRDVSWRSWLRDTLTDVRRTALGCPGTARWLLMRGGATPAAADLMADGVAVLAAAGFGEEAPKALMFAFTSTMNLVAMTDERRRTDHPAEQHDGMAEALAVLAAERPALGGIPGLAANLTTDAGLDDVFDYVLARVLDGLERRLAELSP